MAKALIVCAFIVLAALLPARAHAGAATWANASTPTTGNVYVANNSSGMVNAANGTCYTIQNLNGHNIFVPNETLAEWTSFAGHLESGVTLSDCGCKGTINFANNAYGTIYGATQISYSIPDGGGTATNGGPSCSLSGVTGVVGMCTGGQQGITFTLSCSAGHSAITHVVIVAKGTTQQIACPSSGCSAQVSSDGQLFFLYTQSCNNHGCQTSTTPTTIATLTQN